LGSNGTTLRPPFYTPLSSSADALLEGDPIPSSTTPSLTESQHDDKRRIEIAGTGSWVARREASRTAI
ncbi:MAG: hypothetical protein LC770_07885, partial [Acidobacteria bacterium]|nr:hypothetical protein [Acidobacteriota bacterium]